jgi:N-methylhydantoinase B
MGIAKNDVVRHVTAGGKGHGDAFERESQQVLVEVLDGKVSVTSARDAYGVVIEDDAVDQAKTASLRAARERFDDGRSRSDRA